MAGIGFELKKLFRRKGLFVPSISGVDVWVLRNGNL